MRILVAFVTLSLAVLPVAASAQQRAHRVERPRLIISEKAIAGALAAEQPAMGEQRDSLKNGAIIGAIVGGIALGGFVGFLCNALQESSDPSCVPPSLLYTGIGAGIGAAGGAGIDALFSAGPERLPRDRRPGFGGRLIVRARPVAW
jgi:hypothetical protein